MPFVRITATMKVALEYTLNGQLVVNVYHVRYPSPIVTADLTAVAAIFANWWSVNMRQNFTTGMSLTRIVVTDMDEEAGLQISYVTGLPQAGTLAQAPASNNVALVTSLRTPFSGRSNRGRKYWAGFNNAEVTDNFASTTLTTAILADMLSLKTALDTANFDFVVASLYSDNAPREVGVTQEVTAFTMDTRVDTQRRRLPGTGA